MRRPTEKRTFEKRTFESLPQGLQRQFRSLRQRLWQVESVMAVSAALTGLLLSYWLVFLLDRLMDTPAWLRVGLLGFGGVVVLGGVLFWLMRWLVRPWRLTQLARQVQNRFRRLGDRLLSIVELSGSRDQAPAYSPALYEAAVDQVAELAGKYDFRQAVDQKWFKIWKRSLAVLSGLTVISVSVFPSAGMNAFQRWIYPTAGIERYTLVEIGDLPSKQVVPQGEAFAMTVSVDYRSFWTPNRVAFRYEEQPWSAGRVTNGTARLEVPAQVEAGQLRIQVGDAEKRVEVVPKQRPALNRMQASIRLPDYLHYPELTREIGGGSIEILKGSRVRFSGEAARPLTEAGMALGESDPIPLTVDGNRFASDWHNLDQVFECRFVWRDDWGLTGAAPWQVTIKTTKDNPPKPTWVDRKQGVAILESEVLPITGMAEDDFGVKALGLDWKVASTDDGGSTNQTSRSSSEAYRKAAQSYQRQEFERTFRFSPAQAGIPPNSTVELRLYATDYLPGREKRYSQPYRLHVVGLAQHAEMVREELESLMMQTEEVTRLEEEIEAETSKLAELSPEALQEKMAQERTGEARQKQLENASRLESLAKKGMKTLRQGLRNPMFSEETLREWTEKLNDMRQLAQKEMRQSAREMQSAQNASGKRARSEMKKANQTQQSILKSLESMQSEVNKGLDQLQALTLAQRLRRLGHREEQLGKALKEVAPETIGLFPKELPTSFREQEKRLAKEQAETKERAKAIREEIGRFYERTEIPRYGKVNDQMKEANTPQALQALREAISDNLVMDGITQSTQWSERFQEWGELLEPEKSESGQGGGSGKGSGQQGQQMMEQLLSLLRLRQDETNLKERTEIFSEEQADGGSESESESESERENGKTGESDRREIKELTEQQRQLKTKLAEVRQKSQSQLLNEPLTEAESRMDAAESRLAEGKVGASTQNAQQESVVALTDAINLINELSQKSSSSSSSSQSRQQASQSMAFLMQMMGQSSQPGKMKSGKRSGAGSMAGGSTDSAGSAASGDMKGSEQGEEKVTRTSGLAERLPPEYQKALENYFRAVETRNE